MYIHTIKLKITTHIRNGILTNAKTYLAHLLSSLVCMAIVCLIVILSVYVQKITITQVAWQ